MSIRKGLVLLVLAVAVALPVGSAHAACTPDAAAEVCVDSQTNPEETFVCVALVGHYDGETCALVIPQTQAGLTAAALCSDYDLPGGRTAACGIVFASAAGVAGYFQARVPTAGCTGGFVIVSPFGGSDYEIGPCS